MKLSELEIGEFYNIKSTTRKKVLINKLSTWGLNLTFVDTINKEDKIYKESYFQYVGQTVKKIEKRVDSKRKKTYSYRPHKMLCLKTGCTYNISGYYIQTYFVKPKK
tara:strand:+ start:468 stop:788 length:321 start_codon:yes stop_codon:yes gene_type:complete